MGPISGSSTKSGKVGKPELVVRGMFGIGDCLHERAVLRTLIKAGYAIELDTYYTAMFHDLVGPDLKLFVVKDRGRIGDAGNRSGPSTVKIRIASPIARPPAPDIHVTYNRESILKHGSILAAMFEAAGLRMPPHPDFSLPVKPEWRAAARALLAKHNPTGKSVLVYRPIVLNTTWTATARAPDPKTYDALYRTIRKKFFVVGIAALVDKREWIVGGEPDVDLALHNGELDFETMAGLFAEAAMVFANPGFTPVLAQAVGTPVIIVYGGNESFRTTNSVGAHLAPTLAIDLDKPCECHTQTHKCDKTTTLPPAKAKVMKFVDDVLNKTAKAVTTEEPDKAQFGKVLHERPKPRVLIFGTTYVDTPERAKLTRQWSELHSRINPDCDLMMVDSASPLFQTEALLGGRVQLYLFQDNIGHLSRNGPKGPKSQGRDGWGRAFCKGLEIACDKGYDYAVHIEGDSLFRKDVMLLVKTMQAQDVPVMSVPVKGTRNIERDWVETGLMLFSVEYLRQSGFIKAYDWPNRKPTPTPERVIFNQLGKSLHFMELVALRGDKNQITSEDAKILDWITHASLDAYDSFVESIRDDKGAQHVTSSEKPAGIISQESAQASPPKLVKLNFGCGTNRLEGWKNYDNEVNITKRLPFSDNTADFVLAEHCVEHTDYRAALDFFRECRRILKPGGVVRVTVPSLEKIMLKADAPYIDFVHGKGWAPTKDRRGVLDAIIYKHGHRAIWTQSLLEAALYYAGFGLMVTHEPGKSAHKELQGVEGHHRVIGEHFNAIESVSVEGTADK